MNSISFPGLGLSFNITPTVKVFGLTIHYYGVIIACGLLLAVVFCDYLAKKEEIPKDTIIDITIYATPIAIICARLYFVLFNFADYRDDLSEIYKIWHGGIAIYGGIIGAVITAYLYCRIKKINALRVFDVCVFGLLIGQAIGRWGNFVNVEAYGCETSLPWRMEIYNEVLNKTMCVHPTFLYESLWNIIGFVILLCYLKHKKYNGEIFLMYIAWYGLGRAWIEQLRVDSLPYNGNFKISQIVAIVSFIVSVSFMIYFKVKKKKPDTVS